MRLLAVCWDRIWLKNQINGNLQTICILSWQAVSAHKPRAIDQLVTNNWLKAFAIVIGLYVGLPLSAPLFMRLEWIGLANVIYTFYSFQCHQLPQRSFCLFGPNGMYSLSEIQSAWQNTANPMVLRQLTGNPEMGWKVAWSDRMVYMYAGTLVFGLIWWPLRLRLKELPWWG